jgi:hypothetical protein
MIAGVGILTLSGTQTIMFTSRKRLYAFVLSSTVFLSTSCAVAIFAECSYLRRFSDFLPNGFAHLDLMAKRLIYASVDGFPWSA